MWQSPTALYANYVATTAVCVRGAASVLRLEQDQVLIRNLWQTRHIRVEELKVRGQTRSIVVTTKGPIPGSYEIFIGDPSRDLSDAAGSRRGATGQRMWRVLTF